ncbi:MAG: hypothetical protein AAB091_03585, partial [Elusimicrobiota bacterium]
MLNFFWAIMLALLAYCLARRAGLARRVCLIGALSLYASPIVVALSTQANTDLAATCFAMAGFLALLAGVPASGGSAVPPSSASGGLAHNERPCHANLWLSAALCGFSLNKYTMFSYPLATAALMAWQNHRRPLKLFEGLSAYALSAVLCLAPFAWYLWKTCGNPFYPIPLGNLPFDPIEAAQQAIYLPASLGLLANHLWETALGAQRMVLSPLIILAPLALFFLQRLKGGIAIIVLWSAAGFLPRYLAFGEPMIVPRYCLASYACWLILAGAFAGQINAGGRWNRRLINTFILGGLIFPCLVVSFLSALPQIELNFGRIKTQEYFKRYYPREGWSMVETVNQLPDQSRIAVIDHHYAPYYYRDLGAHLWPIPVSLLSLNDPNQIKQELQRQGITHVLVIADQWNPVKSKQGFILEALYLGPGLTCRWWENQTSLPYLQTIAQTSGGILFKFQKDETGNKSR